MKTDEPAQLILDRLYELRHAFIAAGLEPPTIALGSNQAGWRLHTLLRADPYYGPTMPLGTDRKDGANAIEVAGLKVTWPDRPYYGRVRVREAYHLFNDEAVS